MQYRYASTDAPASRENGSVSLNGPHEQPVLIPSTSSMAASDASTEERAMPPTPVLLGLPAELRVMIYRAHFDRIKQTAIEDLHRADRIDDDCSLVPISTLTSFLDICISHEQISREAWPVLLGEYIPLHGYAANSIADLVYLLDLPQMLLAWSFEKAELPSREQGQLAQGLAYRHHEVTLVGRGFVDGRRYLNLLEPMFEEDLEGDTERTPIRFQWLFTDESVGTSRTECIDKDTSGTCPADDAVSWELEVEMQRAEEVYLELKVKVWPDARFQMQLRGKLVLLGWDFGRLRPQRDTFRMSNGSNAWGQTKDLVEEVAGFFNDDSDFSTPDSDEHDEIDIEQDDG